MTAKKKTSKTGPAKIDGKEGPGDQLQQNKLPSKYTLLRTKEDIKKIEKVRNQLKNSQIEYYHNSYKADSKIYKELPDLYLNAVKKIHDQDQLQRLRTHFCRIIELCDDQQEDRSPIEKKQKCSNLDPGDPDCKGCDGYNPGCEDYDAESE